MRKIIIILTLILTATLVASPMKKLKETESKIFDLVNKKYKINSKEDKERVKKIKDDLESIIAYDTIAKNVLRGKNVKTKKRHWDSITPEQKVEFRTLYRALIEKIWIKQLKKANNKKGKIAKKYKIKYKNEKVSGKVAMVYTIVDAKDEVTQVDFRFYDGKIVDFIIDERSTVRRYRRSFSKHINKNGFESLLKKMKKRLNEI